MASSRGQPDCWKPYASYLGKVKLNLGCWIFYQKGYVNIDRNREVRADRYEDIATLPSFAANCADEIYAGHVAEHVDDVKASFGRWFEVLKPGGRITITVPDCRGANRMWLERKRFPALELGPDEGIIAITTGVKVDDLGGQKRRRSCIIESSTNRRCEYAWKRQGLSTSPRSITTKRWSRPPRRWAGNSRSKVINQSAAKD